MRQLNSTRRGIPRSGVFVPGAWGDAASMILPRVRASDQGVEVNRDEITPDSQLLSVAEIQQALRGLRARKLSEAAKQAVSKQGQITTASHGDRAVLTRTDPLDDPKQWACSPADAAPTAFAHGLKERWVSVVAAHAGAGASTVALAIADAAAVAGRDAHLVETAHPRQSGLVAAADVELGIDPDGAWRRGRRGRLTVHRRSTNDSSTGWPALPASADGLVVIDLSSPMPDSLTRLLAGGNSTVVVCRLTVPGVRLVEQVLSTSVTGPVIIASVGARRWAAEVSASLGPRLQALLAGNAVVTVPTVRRLEVSGLTSSPLPKPVAAAGRSLLNLLDAAHSGGATASTQPALGSKGTQ